jgi:hypothetical protein
MFGLLRKPLLAACRYPAVALLSIALVGCVGLGSAFIISYAWAEYHYQAAQYALERRDLRTAHEHIV